MNFDSICVHGYKDENNSTGSIATPIYQTATFEHIGVNQSTGYDYSRLQNPTRQAVESIVAKLEEGVDSIAFSSGMAAISTLLELFSPGDHIIATDDLYGGSIRLFNNISVKNGLKIDYIDTADVEKIRSKINDKTKAIFIETPTNPMMHVTDISEVKKIICDRDILLIVDNTFLTPYFQRPLLLGADIVVHSGTKFLGGHNDTLAGFLVTSQEEIAEKLRFIFKTKGACLSPFDSFLIIRGIKTLALRLEKSQQNAMLLVQWLLRQKCILAVHYIGLETHPSYEISRKQASGFGSMISFEVDCERTAHKILESLNMVMFAESLGGVESLITYPMLQTHADVPLYERERRGINKNLLRLSVGIENISDIIADFEQALLQI